MRHYYDESGNRHVDRGLGMVLASAAFQGLGKVSYGPKSTSQVSRYNIVPGGNCTGSIFPVRPGFQDGQANKTYGTTGFLTFDQLSQLSTASTPIPVTEVGGTGAVGWVIAAPGNFNTVGYITGSGDSARCNKVNLISSSFYVATPDGGLVQVPAGSYNPGMKWDDLVTPSGGGGATTGGAPGAPSTGGHGLINPSAIVAAAAAVVQVQQLCQTWWQLYPAAMNGIVTSLQNPPFPGGNGINATAAAIGQIAMGVAPTVGWPNQATIQGLISQIPGYPFTDQNLVSQFVNNVISCAQTRARLGTCQSGYRWDAAQGQCVPNCPTTGNAAWLPPDQASTLVCDPAEQVYTDRTTGCVTCVPKRNCWQPGGAPLPCPAPLVVSSRGKYVCCEQSGATYTPNPYTGAQPGGAGPLPAGPPPALPQANVTPTAPPPPPPSEGILDTLKDPANRKYVVGGAIALGALILLSVVKGRRGGGGGGRAREMTLREAGENLMRARPRHRTTYLGVRQGTTRWRVEWIGPGYAFEERYFDTRANAESFAEKLRRSFRNQNVRVIKL